MNRGRPTDEDLRRAYEIFATRKIFSSKDTAIEAFFVEGDRSTFRRRRDVLRMLLRSLLSDPDFITRNEATECLGEIATRQDLRALKERTRDEEWLVRASAFSALSNLGRQAAPAIRNGLADRHPAVRRYAIVALFDAIGHAVENEARHMLDREASTLTRVGIVGVLALCGDIEALEELEDYAQWDHEHYSSPAQGFLEDIPWAGPLHPAAV